MNKASLLLGIAPQGMSFDSMGRLQQGEDGSLTNPRASRNWAGECNRCFGRGCVEDGDPEAGGNQVPCPNCSGKAVSHTFQRVLTGQGNMRGVTATCSCGWRGIERFAYEDTQLLDVMRDEARHTAAEKHA